MAVAPELLEDEVVEVRKIFVRCREPHLAFRKSKLIYPPIDDKDHKDDPPTVYEANVQGYDEFGDGVCPVYEVEDGPEISDAINNDKTMHPKRKVPIFNGRLVSVRQDQLTKFPRWIGQPTLDDAPITVYKKVRAINREKLKGDGILGRVRPEYQECRMPHGDKSSENDNLLWKRYEDGKEAFEKAQANKPSAEQTDPPKEVITAKS